MIQVFNINSDSTDYKEALSMSHFTFLAEEFYKNYRCEMIPARYLEIANKAKLIELPDQLGIFLSQEHYLQTIQLLFLASEETRHRIIFIIKQVLPLLIQRNSFVDIGPGDARLANFIGHFFHSITLLDKNKKVLDEVTFRGSVRNKTITKLYYGIEEVSLKQNQYDFIIMGHMLYYIDPDKWLDILKKAWASLKTNGILLIIFSNGLGKTKLAKEFNGRVYDFEKFVRELNVNLTSKMKVYFSKEIFQTSDLLSMLHLTGVLLHDAGVSVKKSVILDYIENNFKINDSQYNVDTYQHFVVMHKENT